MTTGQDANALIAFKVTKAENFTIESLRKTQSPKKLTKTYFVRFLYYFDVRSLSLTVCVGYSRLKSFSLKVACAVLISSGFGPNFHKT